MSNVHVWVSFESGRGCSLRQAITSRGLPPSAFKGHKFSSGKAVCLTCACCRGLLTSQSDVFIHWPTSHVLFTKKLVRKPTRQKSSWRGCHGQGCSLNTCWRCWAAQAMIYNKAMIYSKAGWGVHQWSGHDASRCIMLALKGHPSSPVGSFNAWCVMHGGWVCWVLQSGPSLAWPDHHSCWFPTGRAPTVLLRTPGVFLTRLRTLNGGFCSPKPVLPGSYRVCTMQLAPRQSLLAARCCQHSYTPR